MYVRPTVLVTVHAFQILCFIHLTCVENGMLNPLTLQCICTFHLESTVVSALLSLLWVWDFIAFISSWHFVNFSIIGVPPTTFQSCILTVVLLSPTDLPYIPQSFINGPHSAFRFVSLEHSAPVSLPGTSTYPSGLCLRRLPSFVVSKAHKHLCYGIFLKKRADYLRLMCLSITHLCVPRACNRTKTQWMFRILGGVMKLSYISGISKGQREGGVSSQ